MSAVIRLESMGLSLELSASGKLAVEGLKRLSREEKEYALTLARENKASIIEELQRRMSPACEQPDPAALAHAKRMLVSCPVQGRSLHCWYCSRCSEAGKCPAWRGRRADVEFFKKSEKPYSLYLVEEMESGEVLQ